MATITTSDIMFGTILVGAVLALMSVVIHIWFKRLGEISKEADRTLVELKKIQIKILETQQTIASVLLTQYKQGIVRTIDKTNKED